MIAHRVKCRVPNKHNSLTLSFEFSDGVNRSAPVAMRDVELTGDAGEIARFRTLALSTAEPWHPLGKVRRSFDDLNFCEAVLGIFAGTGEHAGKWRFEIESELPDSRDLGEPGVVY